MFERWRHQLLGWWSGVITRYPRTIIVLALLAAAASIALSYQRWHFQSDRNAMLSEDLAWNQRFIQWTQAFAGTTDLTVVLDTGEADPPAEQRRLAQAMADELAEALRREPLVADVVWRVEADQASPRAMRLLDLPQFKERVAQLVQARPVFESPTPAQLISAIVGQMVQQSLAARSDGDADLGAITHELDNLTALVSAIGDSLEDGSDGNAFKASMTANPIAGAADQYLTTENGRLLFLRVTPRENDDVNTLTVLSDAIAVIRARVAEVSQRYPTIEAGVTGIEAIETDETQAMTRDSTLATIVALVLIAIALIVSFHSVRTPMLAVVSLLIGVAWSFGFLYLSVGHLQVLSVFFTVVLLGLGIAYGIHLASRYELVRHQYPDTIPGFARAMADNFRTMGPGIVTGAITTSAAFATTIFTDFTGMAEMGLIASVGIMLCLLAMFSVFPAMLRLFKPGHKDVVPMASRRFHFFEERWCMPFSRWPRTTLLIGLLITLASLAAISRMKFDYDLESLLPTGVDSVTWQRRIVESGQSIYSAVSVVDTLDEARARAQQFRKLGTVADVGGVGLLFPADEAQKVELLREARAELGPAVDEALDPPPLPVLAAQAPEANLQSALSRLRGLASQFAAAVPPELKPPFDRLLAAISRADQVLANLPVEEREARLTRLQHQYQQWRQWLASALDPSPLTTDDLPAQIMRPYVSSSGKLALEVHPDVTVHGTEQFHSPLGPRFLARFVSEMKSVDPDVTGVVVQYYESGRLIFNSYAKAGAIALLIVLALVWFDFRSLDDAVLAVVPVFVGFSVTFGIMHVLGMSLNVANITVLPLMFGIGVDSGVHMLHRYRMDPVTRPLGLTSGTGKGITVTSLTSMIGFGSMMLAHHRGIFSLGFVLTLGMGLTLLSCWAIMPAWLEIRARRRAKSPKPIEA